MKVAADVIINSVKSASSMIEQDSQLERLIKNIGQQIFRSYLAVYFQENSSSNLFSNTETIDEETFTETVERRFIILRQIFCQSSEMLGLDLVNVLTNRCAGYNRMLVNLNSQQLADADLQAVCRAQLSQANHLVLLGSFMIFGHSKLCFYYQDYSFSGFDDFQFAQISEALETPKMTSRMVESFKFSVLKHLIEIHKYRKKLKEICTDVQIVEMCTMAEAHFLGTVCLEALHSSFVLDNNEQIGTVQHRPGERIFMTRLTGLNHALQSLAGWKDYCDDQDSGPLFTEFLNSAILSLLKSLDYAPSCRSGLYVLNTLNSVLGKIKQKLNNDQITIIPAAEEVLTLVLQLRNRTFGSEISKDTRDFRKGIYSFIGCCLFEDDTDDFLPQIMNYGGELFNYAHGESRLARHPKETLLTVFSCLSGMLDAVCSPRVGACLLKMFYPQIKSLLQEHGSSLMEKSDFVEELFSFYKSLNTAAANQLTRVNFLLSLELIRDTFSVTIAVMGPVYEKLKMLSYRELASVLRDQTDVVVHTVNTCAGIFTGGSMDIPSLDHFGDQLFFNYFQLVFKIVGLVTPLLDVDCLL